MDYLTLLKVRSRIVLGDQNDMFSGSYNLHMCCDGRYNNHRVSIKILVNESELLEPFELKCHLTDVSGKLLHLV